MLFKHDMTWIRPCYYYCILYKLSFTYFFDYELFANIYVFTETDIKNGITIINEINEQKIIAILGSIISPNKPPVKLPIGDAAMHSVNFVEAIFPLIFSSVFNTTVVPNNVLKIILKKNANTKHKKITVKIFIQAAKLINAIKSTTEIEYNKYLC